MKSREWPPRLVDPAARTIDYRLNILGIRVWEDHCQLISRNTGAWWITLGLRFDLPLDVPRDEAELGQGLSDPDALTVTALQYLVEWPASDLAEVLSRRKSFAEALGEISLIA